MAFGLWKSRGDFGRLCILPYFGPKLELVEIGPTTLKVFRDKNPLRWGGVVTRGYLMATSHSYHPLSCGYIVDLTGKLGNREEDLESLFWL